MKTTLMCFLYINIFIINLYSQQPNFLPLNIGNEYQMYDGYEYQFGIIERDTVYPNGKTYYHLPSPFDFEDCRVDSAGNVLSISKPFFSGLSSSPEEYMLFKADAVLDEVWPVAWDFNPVIDTGYAKCIYVDSGFIFGKNRLIKGVLIFDFSYYYYYFWLAEGLGLVREQYDDGTTSVLNYAKIDGETYGTLVSVEDETLLIPSEFNLFQNYPNPFNPVTSIKFVLPIKSNINIKIYNTLGKEIKELLNETRLSGEYEITWDGTDNYRNKVSSGVYFITMQANNSNNNLPFRKTIKTILLK